jgi:DNA-binding MarR family transcriptional regulator
VHNAIWAEEIGPELTSPQYSVLATLAVNPRIDQTQVGELASLDKSSTADIVARLISRLWIVSQADPSDGRRKLLSLSAAAGYAIAPLTASMERVQQRLLAPLSPTQWPGMREGLAAIARLPPSLVHNEADGAGALSRFLGVPGHLIRCAQQIHTSIWASEFEGLLTGPQYATLHVLLEWPASNQWQVSQRAGLDKSTAADIVTRLVHRGWIVREPDPTDRRGKLLSLTEAGAALAAELAGRVDAVQERLLEPLTEADRTSLQDQLATVAYPGASAVLLREK